MFALPGSGNCSFARDVSNAPDPMGDPHITGISYAGTCEFESDPCVTSPDGMVWGFPPLIRLPEIEHAGAESYGANDNDEFVGWLRDPNVFPCLYKAVYWPDPFGGAPTILGDLFVGQETRAEAINNLDPPQVAGTNVTTLQGLLWEQVGGNWTVTVLDDEIASSCGIQVRAAHDINDSGWMVGFGDIDPGPVFEIRPFS